MEKNTILWIVTIFIAFYLLQPVPYCKISDVQFEGNGVYTDEDVRELGEITATNLIVKGNSMLPTIQDNSQCLCIRKNTYSIGDIVFFMVKMDGDWTGVVHRISSIDCRGIITKGDNNDFLDSPMEKENIGCAIPMVARYKTLI